MAPFSVPESNPQWTEPSYRNYSISFDSAALVNAGLRPCAFTPVRASLEQAYLAEAGRSRGTQA